MTKKKVFVLIAVIVIMTLSVFTLVACKDPASNTEKENENAVQVETPIPDLDNEFEEEVNDEKKEEKPTSGLVYELSSDGTYYILTDARVAEKYNKVVVDDDIDGVPVKEIASGVFSVYHQSETNYPRFNALQEVIINGNNLTTIGDGAFRGCDTLATIVIPSSLERIGDSAFMNCSALEKMGNSTFITDTTALENIKFPDKLTSIGIGAFRKCTKLENVILPNSLTDISEQAFQGCAGLKYLQISEDTISIGKEAFDSCTNLIVLSNKKINVPTDKQTKIESIITIPDTVTSLGDYVFNNCTKMKKIILSSQLTTVSNGLCFGCTGITVVELNGPVTEIKESAFEKCTSLNKINIPSSLRVIGEKAFSSTSKLSDITLNQNLTRIEDYAFALSGLKQISILGGVKYIGKFAFEECKNLTEVGLPATLDTIDEGAFRRAGKPETVKNEADEDIPTGNVIINFSFTGTVEQWNKVVKRGPYKWGNEKSEIKIICHENGEEVEVDLVLTEIEVPGGGETEPDQPEIPDNGDGETENPDNNGEQTKPEVPDNNGEQQPVIPETDNNEETETPEE